MKRLGIRQRLGGFGVVCFALLLPVATAGAPVVPTTAAPPEAGAVLMRQMLIHRRASVSNDVAQRQTEATVWVPMFGLGLTDHLSTFVALPVADKKAVVTLPDGRRIARSSLGMGDLRVFVRHASIERTVAGGALHAGPLIGLRAPTGRSNVSDSIGPLPPPLQPGAGSWGVFGGFNATWRGTSQQFDLEMRHHRNASAHDYRFGDLLQVDASWQAVSPWQPEARARWRLLLEANVTRAWADRHAGAAMPDSGGAHVLVAPGLQRASRAGIVDVLLQIPVATDRRGNATTEDVALRFGYRRPLR